jgi:hypothetical protein
VGDDEGGLHARQLVAAAGGSWSGLLFDNAAVGLAPALTWTFRVPFAPVDGQPATLEVDWLPLPATGWRSLRGLAATSDAFAEPAECFVHLNGHHRYDRVRLLVSEQDGTRIRVSVTAAGDLDRLGPPEIAVDAWLDFAGIRVQLGDAPSAAAALDRLAGFTDVTGLQADPHLPGMAFVFTPAAG